MNATETGFMYGNGAESSNSENIFVASRSPAVSVGVTSKNELRWRVTLVSLRGPREWGRYSKKKSREWQSAGTAAVGTECGMFYVLFMFSTIMPDGEQT
jgi:hypothetical protein